MRPNVRLIGAEAHPDFRDAVATLRESAQFVAAEAGQVELVVVAQSRPGAVPFGEVERVMRAAPLAGVVALLGSWCEGEARTGRPWRGVQRLYWYEFPAWW